MDHREEFEDWVNMWDQAQKDNIFPEDPKLAPGRDSDDDYFEEDPYDQYCSNLDRMAEEDEAVLHEGKTPNPVYPDSVGKDQDFPQASWTNTKAIKEVLDLKKQLYEVECKMNSQDAGGKKWQLKPLQTNDKKLWNQIESIRKRIDTLSDTLGIDDSDGPLWKFQS